MSAIADPPVAQQRVVRLIQCGRRSCGFILTEEERKWTVDPKWEARQTAVCPRCGEDGFYTLKPNGQKTTMKERDKYRDGIDPTLIDPAPRMGPKMRAGLLAAKRRILATEETVADARKRLLKCLRHISPVECCGKPMAHGGIVLGEAPITACMICGKGLPADIAAECGIPANH